MSTLLKEFRKKAQLSQRGLMVQHEGHEEMKAVYHKNHIGNLLQEKLDEENAAYSAAVEAERQKLKAELAETGKLMLDTLKRSAATPPTQAQLALLQTLSMRSNISQREIEDLAEQLKDSYTALKVLADIAESKGYLVHLAVDYDAAIADAETALEYGAKMLNELGGADLTYNATSFYGDYSQVEWDYLTDGIEGSELMDTPKVEKRTITEAEQAILDQLFHDGKDYVSTVEAVRSAYKVPELARLIDMSSYAVCLDAAENTKE